MANKKNFILMSMEDDKIKKVSNVISNDSCRKILDYLANKEATESELAEKLGIPISTVHYNLQQLKQTELVESDEYHYSSKGKEVQHYRLANKYIIIAPKKTHGIMGKLRGILPAALIASGAALVLQYTKNLFAHGGSTSIFTQSRQTLIRETLIAQDSAKAAGASAADSLIRAAPESAAESSAAVQQFANKTIEYFLDPEIVTQTVANPPSMLANIALWFFIGALFALLAYLAINLIRKDSH
jgi:DNA-binding transcriptional ArsR family regulator